ncbi:ATPase domain-containing protein [Pseudonocardia acidicola]|uniref:non-specific serine/threonine protein kinase n=1 Tax=Pseudonocardia acidicola TaxID=2724939 RepID=A0ABX1S5C9_9PSEU|nr:ATPase domain-containing protein [Pseudonocardia acidicola]NMH96788.1 AAA family ATPase [Pseudonocardia acidicola]
MADRMMTGAQRLDDVLGGGLPRDGITLIVGLPGSGKTILAQQCAFANARADRPALYLSTVSEPLEKLLRFGQTLTFFKPTEVGKSVFYEDLGVILQEGGLSRVLDGVRGLIRERRPAMIVIDSFKALRVYATDDADFRRFLHGLAGLFSAYPVTTLWVGEYGEEEIVLAPEFAVADAIIALGDVGVAERTARALQVQKLRGGDFLSGKHAYRLSSSGVTVFPRLADPRDATDYSLGEVRCRSGIAALDDMLKDGFWPGSSILLAGPTGVGKTLMGLSFVFHGAREGDPGLVATMQENPAQLERAAQQFGWSMIEDGITLLYRSPVDLYLDEWVYELLDLVEATGARRVLIDSLGDLQGAASDVTRFREYLYSLTQRCSRRGVSLLMTYEVPELYGLTRLSEHNVSHLADNVVLLRFRESGRAVSRTLTVLKSRAGGHDVRVREFEISTGGITLTSSPS